MPGPHGAGERRIAVEAREVTKVFGQEPEVQLLLVEQAAYSMFGGAEPISRQLLDRILPGRPLALFASDHHTMWANTAALQAAGLLQGLSLIHI